MDTDWCLTCNCHLAASSSSPYCSPECQPYQIAGDDTSSSSSFDELSEEAIYYHDVEDAGEPASHYTGNDYDGIVAWAAAVVPGIPVQEISRPSSRCSTSSSRSSIMSSISSRQRSSTPSMSSSPVATFTYRPPELLKKHRPLPPTLCMSSSKPARPSSATQPIGAVSAQPTLYSTTTSAANSISTRNTDSSLHTPVSGSAMPYSLAAGIDGQFPISGYVLESLKSWIAPSPLSAAKYQDDDQPTPAQAPMRYVPSTRQRGRQYSSRAAA